MHGSTSHVTLWVTSITYAYLHHGLIRSNEHGSFPSRLPRLAPDEAVQSRQLTALYALPKLFFTISLLHHTGPPGRVCSEEPGPVPGTSQIWADVPTQHNPIFKSERATRPCLTLRTTAVLPSSPDRSALSLGDHRQDPTGCCQVAFSTCSVVPILSGLSSCAAARRRKGLFPISRHKTPSPSALFPSLGPSPFFSLVFVLFRHQKQLLSSDRNTWLAAQPAITATLSSCLSRD
ncbi:hypothetical protein BT67DRAFT_190371 [Trichocladium antarcticum]|uniref:Uncharacterized protein n=1 Tax=Trichocladium antarcticum TaxID=1450529 RepID=A0AAN6UQ25_9PEZI|nr:hypothetical protein BT67DRAFT_190371 [Trichocladium antarcticum]